MAVSWQYGDDSHPQTELTAFGELFVVILSPCCWSCCAVTSSGKQPNDSRKSESINSSISHRS
ncbi:MAG UNVERIFIED_CONTAM: hypothetical protein LVR29_13270 [Microcystis novacekii LVE1205-3]